MEILGKYILFIKVVLPIQKKLNAFALSFCIFLKEWFSKPTVLYSIVYLKPK